MWVLRRVIGKKTRVGSSSPLAKLSILPGGRGGPAVSGGAGRTCGARSLGESRAESREKSIPHLMPRPSLSPPAPSSPRKVSRQPVHTDLSKCPHPPQTASLAWTRPGLSFVRPGWGRSPPCGLVLPLLVKEGLQPAGSEAERRPGGALVRAGSKPLAGKGCGSHGETWPLTWALPGPRRWAPSPRRWRGPAKPWCSWARRHRSRRRHRRLPLLAETHSRSPRPGGLDPGAARRPPRPQPGRLSRQRGARKGARS